MTIETELRAFLISAPDVSGLVADRVYPMPAPQDAGMPFITWQRITGGRVSSLGGPSGLAYPTIQLDCWSDAREQGGSYLQAKAVATAVRQALDGYSGVWASGRVALMLLDDRDLFEDQTRTYRVSMDFRIWHEEA